MYNLVNCNLIHLQPEFLRQWEESITLRETKLCSKMQVFLIVQNVVQTATNELQKLKKKKTNN